MFEIEFYEDSNGYSEVWEWLEELRLKAKTDKNARIQFNQAVSYIDLLAKNGTRLSKNITKHLDGNIWELRPGNNRILYFFSERRVHIRTAPLFPKENRENAAA